MGYNRYWRPSPIKTWFADHPDLLLLWETLDIKEEKQVPISSDDTIAESSKVDLQGITRSNFRPHDDWMHLMVICRANSITEPILPPDVEEAYKIVLGIIKERK